MRTIGAAKFKEQCLSLLEELEPEGLVVTKRGVPIARVIPIARAPEAAIGALAGRIRITGDLLSTGLSWDAE